MGTLQRKAHRPQLIAALASIALLVLGLGLGPVPALALQSTGDGSWVWQNPLPEGNTIQDISCPGPDTCVAVEGAGGVLRSTDSGATWTWTASSAKILYGDACFDLTTCYAVGDNGAIIKTTNGTSWATQTSGTTALLHDISCPSASSCFAIGLSASLKTTNGGTTWTSLTGGYGNGVSCPTTTVCYAVYPNGTISVTTDGGTTWTVQNSGSPNEYFVNISCPTTTTCFAVSGGGNIFHTSDGGSTWNNQVYSGLHPFLYSVSCVSALICFAAGGNFVLKTTNGGTTWTSSSDATWGLDAISCAPAPATTCYAAGGVNLVVRTTDGGTTWSHLRSTGVSQTLSSVSCPGTRTCFSVGLAGTIMATTNGGSLWSTQASATTQWLHAVSCPDVSTCFAAGTNGLIIGTSNGGTTWTQKASIAGISVFNGITCPSSSQCTAVASAGNIRATTNGGTTWVAQTSNTTQTLYSISCASSQVCRAVGSQGTILATANGGTTWTAQTSGTTGRLNGITCTTVTTCYAVGDGPTFPSDAIILTTRDGGSSWSIQTISGVSLSGVGCRTDLACYAVGGENFTQLGALATIVSTNDGSTWTKASVGATSPLSGVACPASCWAVGSSGAILAGPVGVVDAAGSAVVANPPFVLADGVSTAAITVTLMDTAGNPIAGKTVSLAKVAGPGAPVITPPSGTTNGAGQLGFTVSSSTVGRDTFRATDTTDTVVLTQTADVTFTGPVRAVLPALANAAYGGYITSVYVQNVGSAAAAGLAIEYFDQAGNFVGSGDVTSNLPSRAAWTVRQDTSHSFPVGGAGSALLFSDQPVAVFVNEFAPGNVGDATSYSGVQVPTGVGTTLYAPTIVNNAYGGYTTGIGLLNEGGSPTDVTITYRDGSGAVINTQTVSGLAAHAYRGLYSGDAALGLPSGFAGTATITSSAGQPLGAIVNETGPGGQFSSYDAVPSGSTTLYAPAALNNAFGGYNTGMGIVNTTGAAGSVTINYYDAAGAATTTTHPIAANGSLGVYQGTDIPSIGAYTATITSTVAIAAIVNEVAPSSTSAMQSTSYNTFSSGAATLNLPLVENAGSDPWNTGEGIMNTGAASTTVTVNYYDTVTGAAVGTPQSLTLAPNAFWGLYQPNGGLPIGTRATAVITTSSGGQVAVICNESSSTTFMSYDGQ